MGRYALVTEWLVRLVLGLNRSRSRFEFYVGDREELNAVQDNLRAFSIQVGILWRNCELCAFLLVILRAQKYT